MLVSSSETGLQNQLDTLQRWCDRGRMRVNVDKTKIVHFRKETQQKTEFEFKFHAEKVDKVDSYRYLGLELSDKLDFSHSVNVLSSGGGKALGNLIFRHKNAHGLPYSVYTKLYQSTVVPVMDYSCEIWGVSNLINVITFKIEQCARFLELGNSHQYQPCREIWDGYPHTFDTN